MKLGKSIKKAFGKKKSGKRRNAGLGSPQDSLQDSLASSAPAPALSDSLLQASQPPPLPWKQAQRQSGPRQPSTFGSRGQQPSRKYADVKSADEHYDGEFEHATWRGESYEKARANGININTMKATEDDFDSRYNIGVGPDGKLTGANGEVLDSETATSGAGAAGLLTYAMNPDGKFGAADAMTETERGRADALAWKRLPEEERAQTEAPDYSVFHHSSFFGDDDVAAAGEMKVKDGLLKQIDNNTGHFKTRDSQTVQALSELDERGANIDHANVNLRNFTNADVGDVDRAQTLVPASAFMASGGNADAHWAKANLNSSILQMGAMSDALGSGNDDRLESLEEVMEDFMEANDELEDDQLNALMQSRAAELGLTLNGFDIEMGIVSVGWATDENGQSVAKSPQMQAVTEINKAEKAKKAKKAEPENPPTAYGPLGYNESPLGYANAPLGYANAPLGYANAPLGYANAPLGYSESPLGYANAPVGNDNSEVAYSQMPLGYSDAPLGYSDAPLGYSDAPLGYSEAPLGYSESPLGDENSDVTYSQMPLGYSNAPLGYSEAPLGYSNLSW